MLIENPIMIWLIAGVAMMLAEIVVPGGIVIFLGAAALLVAGAWHFSLIDSWPQAMTTWFISALVLLLAFRNVTQTIIGGRTTLSNVDEDMDVYGKIAKVTETIGPGEKPGRIEFQDSSWMALADGSIIEVGASVKIICRENISLVVEKIASTAPDQWT